MMKGKKVISDDQDVHDVHDSVQKNVRGPTSRSPAVKEKNKILRAKRGPSPICSNGKKRKFSPMRSGSASA